MTTSIPPDEPERIQEVVIHRPNQMTREDAEKLGRYTLIDWGTDTTNYDRFLIRLGIYHVIHVTDDAFALWLSTPQPRKKKRT